MATAYLPTPSTDLSSLDAVDDDYFSCYAAQDYQMPNGSPSMPSDSLPILLKLHNPAKNLDQTLEASHLHVYESPSQTRRNVWKDCKQKALKMISDASRSPLDLILDILDSTQEEHEHYRSRWFSI